MTTTTTHTQTKMRIAEAIILSRLARIRLR